MRSVLHPVPVCVPLIWKVPMKLELSMMIVRVMQSVKKRGNVSPALIMSEATAVNCFCIMQKQQILITYQ